MKLSRAVAFYRNDLLSISLASSIFIQHYDHRFPSTLTSWSWVSCRNKLVRRNFVFRVCWIRTICRRWTRRIFFDEIFSRRRARRKCRTDRRAPSVRTHSINITGTNEKPFVLFHSIGVSNNAFPSDFSDDRTFSNHLNVKFWEIKSDFFSSLSFLFRTKEQESMLVSNRTWLSFDQIGLHFSSPRKT